MNRTRAIVVVSFVLAFAAGASVGALLLRPAPGHEPLPPPPEKLAPELEQKAREIWSVPMTLGRQQMERMWQLTQERDRAVVALLTEEQKTRYDQVMKDFGEGMAKLDQERRAAFREAERQTKAILTPEQAKLFDAQRSRREHGSGFGFPGFGGPGFGRGERDRDRPGPRGTPGGQGRGATSSATNRARAPRS